MRGKHYNRDCGGRAYGITPADAGKTYTKRETKKVGRDHPRGCGENIIVYIVAFVKPGSPPRMRGKRRGSRTPAFDSRITPADAGKTWVFGFLWRARWDHPRGCGENAAVAVEKSDAAGSPPRMRGKRQHPELALLFHGITPADAGKTLIYLQQSPT